MFFADANLNLVKKLKSYQAMYMYMSSDECESEEEEELADGEMSLLFQAPTETKTKQKQEGPEEKTLESGMELAGPFFIFTSNVRRRHHYFTCFVCHYCFFIKKGLPSLAVFSRLTGIVSREGFHLTS